MGRISKGMISDRGHEKKSPLAVLSAVAFGALLAVIPARAGDVPSLAARFRDPPSDRRILQIVHGLPASPEARAERLARLARRGFGGIVANVAFDRYLRSEEHWAEFLSGFGAARAAGMTVWLYDEDGYPSAAAGGIVLEEHPEWEARGLLCTVLERDGGVPTEIALPEGDLVSLTAHPYGDGGPRLDGAVDLRGAVGPDRRARFDRPGRWRICGFTEARLYEGTHAEGNLYRKRRYPDILSRDAIRRFVELTHGAYAARIGPLAGKVEASFTDEPSLMSVFLREMPLPALPWSPGLADAFRRLHGRDLVPLLPALVSDFGADPQVRVGTPRRARCEFWETVGREAAEAYFGTIRDWCRAHGIASSGHLLAEEDLGSHVGFYGDFFSCASRLDIPGIDCLTSDPAGVPWHIAKLIGSIACVEGRAKTMSETSDHAQRWRGPGDSRPRRDVTAAEILGTNHLLYAAGINTTTSYYPWSGLADDEVRRINLDIGRCGTVLEGGRHVAEVAVLYPRESAWAHFTPQRLWASAPEVRRIDAVYRSALDSLFPGGRDLDVIDATALARAEAAGGALRLGEERFRVLVLPAVDVLPIEALRKVADLARSGGTVIALGEVPASTVREFPSADARAIVEEVWGAGALDAARDAERAIERVLPSGGRGVYLPAACAWLLPRVVDRILEPDFRAPAGSPLRAAHRLKDGRHFYFVVNCSGLPWSGPISTRGEGPAERWDPATGEIAPAPASADNSIVLSLPPYGAAFLAFPSWREAKARGGSAVGGLFVEAGLEAGGAGSPALAAVGPSHVKAAASPLGAGPGPLPARVTAKIEKGGVDSWCFADLRFPRPADFSRSEALEVVAAVPAGKEAPGARLLAIVVEEAPDGRTADYIADLDIPLDTAGRRRAVPTIAALRLAGWSKDPDGRLDLDRVRSIRIGWGGHIGREGEEVVFDLESVRFLRAAAD
jgi:hypothetical protein